MLRDPSKGIAQVVVALFLTSIVVLGADEQSKQDVPVVVSAAVPFYPPDAQMANIEGVVRLSISIDGEAVTGVERLDGQIMLGTCCNGECQNVATALAPSNHLRGYLPI
jgi:hypothetical protein